MKKIIIGGLLSAVVIIVMGMIFGAASSEMYKMSPKELWKPMGGDWFTKMIVYDILLAFILASAFSLVRGSIPGEGILKGVIFGLILFMVGPFLGLSMTYLTMAVRTKLISVWALNNLINYLVSGVLFEIIAEKIT